MSLSLKQNDKGPARKRLFRSLRLILHSLVMIGLMSLAAGSPEGLANPADSEPESARPRNILTNGDFEYGLGCFRGIWNWPESSGHTLIASTDAYSGNYSMSIECPADGTCERGGFWTQPIWGTGEYTLSFHAKSNGATLRVWIRGPDLNIVQEVPPTTWASYERTFMRQGNFTIYFMSLGRGTVWVDDVRLIRADETTPELPEITHPKQPLDVKFDAERFLTIDGTRFFPIATSHVTKEQLSEVKEAGINTILSLPFECESGGQDPFDYWNRAQELGLRIIPELTMIARARNEAALASYLRDYGGHPAVIAWFLADEPDHSALDFFVISPDMLYKQYRQITKLSNLPVGIDHQTAWDLDVIRQYAATHDFFLFEPYPDPNESLHAYGRDMEYAEESAPGQPVWFFQYYYEDRTWQLTTMYMSIISGARGIIFWNFDEGFEETPETHESFKAAVHEASRLQDVLVGETATSPSCNNRHIKFIAKKKGDGIYLIALNAGNETEKAKFQKFDASSISVLFEDRVIKSDGDSFTDTFAPYERHVYLIQKTLLH